MSHLFLTAWLLAFTGDAASTHVALNRGAHEVMMTQNPYIDDGLLAAQAVIGALILEKIAKTHPKATRIVGVLGIVSHGTATVWNITQAMR